MAIQLKAIKCREEKLQQIKSLNETATLRNKSLAQMAIAWLMKDKRVTSALIGSSFGGAIE